MLYSWFQHIHFAWPMAFAGFAVLPLMILWYAWKQRKLSGAFELTINPSVRKISSFRMAMRHLPFLFRLLAISALIVALARPQTRFDENLQEGEGIDIVLCMDVSGSMLEEDFLPNRLEAAKEVAANFVKSRATDRIGVVIFSGESFTLVPLTTDKEVLLQQINGIQKGLLEDGTAIGDGLGISVARLKAAATKSKVVILLTDGDDQGGRISPVEARMMAKSYGVRVYTIGVGAESSETLMRSIASETGGLYFKARDKDGLQKIYNEIDQLERSRVEVTTLKRYNERFHPWALLAGIFLVLELLFRWLLLRKISG